MPRTTVRRALYTKNPELEDVRLGLSVAGPLLDSRLAVPPEITLGDTPDGEPAIWWKSYPTLDARAIWPMGGSAKQAFWEFLELADEADSTKFLDFARSFGPIGLWKFQTPDGHSVSGLTDDWVPSAPEGIQTPLRFTGGLPGSSWERLDELGLSNVLYEPIEQWRIWAGWFRASARILVKLCAGELGARGDWESLGYGFAFNVPPYPPMVRFPFEVATQQLEISRFIRSHFLQWAGLVPVMKWTNAGPSVVLDYQGEDMYAINLRGMRRLWPQNCLFPALVAQLLSLALAGSNLFACEEPNCGRLHMRSRQPRRGQLTRCSECMKRKKKESRNRSARKRRGEGRQT